jgi:ribose transport system substrate-binding protein
MRLKRTSLVAAAGAVAVAAALYGSATSSARPAAPEAKTVHLAFVYPGAFANFAQEMAIGAKAAADHTGGVKLTESGPPNNDGNAQVALFQAATHTSGDGIAWMTLFPELFIRPVQQVEKKIPLIAVDVPPPAGTHVQTFVGNSNTQLGQALAKELFKQPSFKCSGGGQILVGTDTPGLPPLVARNNGFMAAIKAKCPKVSFYQFDSKQTATDNFNAWSAAVKSHPHALAYVGPGSEDAVSLAQIQRQQHIKILAGADDLDPIAIQGVKAGYIFALVSPEHWLKGYIAIKLLAKHAQTGAALPKGWWNPGYLVVNKSNVDKIIARQKNAQTRYAYFSKEANAELANPSRYIKPFSKIS